MNLRDDMNQASASNLLQYLVSAIAICLDAFNLLTLHSILICSKEVDNSLNEID